MSFFPAVGAVSVGMLLGSLLFGLSADGVGRKRALFVSLCLHVTFGALAAVMPYQALFLVWTFLSAVGWVHDSLLVFTLCYAVKNNPHFQHNSSKETSIFNMNVCTLTMKWDDGETRVEKNIFISSFLH